MFYQRDEWRGGRVFELDETDPGAVKTYMVYLKDFMGDRQNNVRPCL